MKISLYHTPQAEDMKKMEQTRVDLLHTIKRQNVDNQHHIDKVKFEAEYRLGVVRSKLEAALSEQKVQSQATEKQQITKMSNMNSEYKRFMADIMRQQVELETLTSQRWQELANQTTMIDLRLSKFNSRMEESKNSFFVCFVEFVFS